jgi:large subunit ribosomal protein L21
VYAVVKTGGRQHRAAVGDTVEVNRIPTVQAGDAVELPTVLLVGNGHVTCQPDVLAGITVLAEVVLHRKHCTTIKVTAIRGRSVRPDDMTIAWDGTP